MMKILMISHTKAIWTPYFSRFFISRGYKVLVATFSPEPIEGVDTEFVGVKGYDKLLNKHIFFTKVPMIRHIIRHFKPDLIFAIYFASNGLSAALSWNGPLVVSAVGSDVLDRNQRTGFRRYFRESVIRFVARKADIINTVSQELDDELCRLGVPKSKLLQIPFGVDTHMFYPAEGTPRESATKFICTRAHKPLYDIPILIEALALLKNAGQKFHCTFTSDGPMLGDNKRYAEKVGLQNYVAFTGILEHDKIPNLLREADIYISASRCDGTSVSLLEAMATGLFPVVSQIRANEPWIEHNRTGLLFEVGHPRSLAEDLQKAMYDKQLRQQAFNENIHIVNRDCNMHYNMERLSKAFEKLVDRKMPSSRV